MKYIYILIILIIGLNLNGQIYHEVQKKETLWTIAKNYYGTGHAFVKIWQNSKTVGLTNDPNLIYPGMILVIHTDSNFTVPVSRAQVSGSVKSDTIFVYVDPPTSISEIDEGAENITKEKAIMKSSLLSNIIFPLVVALFSGILVWRYVSNQIKRNVK